MRMNFMGISFPGGAWSLASPCTTLGPSRNRQGLRAAGDPRAAGEELALDVLVTAVDLLDAPDDGAPVGAERGDEERDARANVRARDAPRLAAKPGGAGDPRAGGGAGR